MRSRKATREGAFVVHLHDATRRHWDLRIEIGGALTSFAIPRGPSLDPADKRLAVHTEDHPLEYLDFEAVIPEGNYGAGPMILWDRGAIRYLETSAEEGAERGKLDFTLHGHKLRGRFALVRTSGRRGEPTPKQTQWLLIKKQDVHATTDGAVVDDAPWSVLSGLTIEELANADGLAADIETEAKRLGAHPLRAQSAQWTPMLCDLESAPPALHRKGWLYELKLDGVRILARKDGHDVSLRYRTGRNAAPSYPEIARAVRALPGRRFVLDGEIVAFDERGRPDFHRLGRRIHATRPHDARAAAREVPATYLVFDLLSVGDTDLRALPLIERKRLLRRLVRGKGLVRALDHIEDDGRPLWKLVKSQELEGLIAKRAASTYVLGPRRTSDWIKLKNSRAEDFVVVGWTRGERGRAVLGGLELASPSGPSWRYRGRVGTGFDDATIDALIARLTPLARATCAAKGALPDAPRGRTFVRPEVVVRIRHAGWTPDGHLRHPVFEGFRDDVAPDTCTAAPSEEKIDRALEDSDAHARTVPDRSEGRVTLTNQDKVFWPDEGTTKGDLCRYYAEIADTILPYLRGRPVLMVRYPDGIAGKHFYQWNIPQGTPDWVRAFPIRSEEHDGREVTSFLVDDRDTLLFIANLGAIPLHLLASHADDLDRCDFLTIDFDVGEAPFGHAIQLARGLHALLDEIGLEGFPKTSGQSGLHVLVPLGGVAFEVAKTLAELLGRLLHARHADISTVERMRERRPPGVVYIDTGQTGRSRAIVAPYSVRAHPGATVSTPLSWAEMGFGLDVSRFTIFTVPERVAEHGDPMRIMLDSRPEVSAAVEKLGRLLARSLRGASQRHASGAKSPAARSRRARRTP